MKKLYQAQIVCVFLTVVLCITGCNAPMSPVEVYDNMDLPHSDYEPMNDFLERFSDALAENPVEELLPAREIADEDLSWFLDDQPKVTITAREGILFGNGDMLLVYFFNTTVPDETVLDIVEISISMYGGTLFSAPDHRRSGAVKDGFGFVAYSEHDMDDIISNMVLAAMGQ